ncbi:acyltransferase family protein [Qipengyuania zhejiangensis]|uniref:acyltransferase family protein n=1 Tax=Qipengyuania zhejiangensis TaxID=3077782 RepID=UPI002D77E8AA|nr:acyltransferase [Qipengyuania sp. Z2]
MTEAVAHEPARASYVPRNREFNAATHGLRGIASLMVFFAHLLGGTAEHIYAQNAFYVELVRGPWNVGVWGVELFFTISGFVILPSIQRYSLKDFAERRFLRLYPLFFVLSVLYVLLNALTNAYPGSNNVLTVVSGFLFTNLLTGTEQLTPNAWSLTYEVMFYALAALGFHFLIRKRSWVFGTIILVLAALFIIRYPVALFFVGGMAIRLAHDLDWRPTVRSIRACEIILLAIWIYLAANYRSSFDREFIDSPYAWALLFSTVLYFYFAIQPESLSTAISRSRAVAYLGTVSYSLYLIHPYTYFAVRGLFVRYDLFTDNWALSMGLFFLVTTPITFALTHAAHKLFEIAPYQWYFKERIYRGAKKP